MKDRFQREIKVKRVRFLRGSYFVNNSTSQNISTFSANTNNSRMQKPEQYE